MVQIQEQEDEDVDSQPQSQPQRPPANKSLMESSSYPSPHPPPDSPDTSSSISSDHTFHGFSPRKDDDPPSPPPPVLVPVQPVANRLIRDQPETVTKTEPDAETGFAADQQGRKRRRERRRQQPVWKDKLVKRFGLGLRFFEFVVCLVSFSVMAADKNRGWALDSFDRYTEFRYAMSVNVIGFAYSALQGLDLLCQLTITQNQLRYYFDFTLDQILAYLLLSASSSAFTRVDDWISNWGQDKFPAMASASVGVSFVAFIAFALSSLISGYLLCTHSFT